MNIAPEQQPEEEKKEENVEKFFDEKNYNTLLVKENEFKSTKKAKLEDLIELLKHEDRTKKDIALKMLKDENAQQFLLDSIHNTDNEEHLSILIAACWESGLDFTAHFSEFISLVIDSDYITAIEAYTVIENIEEKLDIRILSDAINLLQAEIEKKNEKMILLSDLKINLIERKTQLTM